MEASLKGRAMLLTKDESLFALDIAQAFEDAGATTIRLGQVLPRTAISD